MIESSGPLIPKDCSWAAAGKARTCSYRAGSRKGFGSARNMPRSEPVTAVHGRQKSGHGVSLSLSLRFVCYAADLCSSITNERTVTLVCGLGGGGGCDLPKICCSGVIQADIETRSSDGLTRLSTVKSSSPQPW